jgi:hypothetical protein
MKPDEFRRIALSMTEASESSHMAHPDFRVGGKIFATLGYPDQCSGVVMLSPEQQKNFLRAHPDAFIPVKGAWGRRGGTHVRLDAVDSATLRSAMVAAWLKRAPKRLIKQ